MEPVLLWKEEPVSPLSYEEASLLDDTLYHESFDDVKLEDSLLTCESKAEVASHILENLENLMDLDDLIKEEPYILDEKMLPLLDGVEPRGAIAVPVPLKTDYYKPQPDHPYFFNDLESVYVELNNGTLTPPQTPPSEHSMLTTLEPIISPLYADELSKSTIYSVPEKQLSSEGLAYPINIPVDYPQLATPQHDIAHELAVVDELLRSRAEDMQWSNGPSSPESSSNSNFGDCSSSEDPEWAPEAVEQGDASSGLVIKSSKKRKHSSVNTDEKKSRKKEQNKNAATRYRLKKKAEVEEILNEEKQLLERNVELSDNITDLQREIKYLKGLMRDLFKVKGVIN